MSVFYNNWYEEKRSAYLYHIMAQHEKNNLHKKLFLDLQKAAESQAQLWETKIPQQEKLTKPFTPDLRTHFVVVLIKLFGTHKINNILSAMKIRGMAVFRNSHDEHQHMSLSSSGNLRAAIFGINDGLVSNLSLILGVVGGNISPNYIILAGIAGLLAGACSMAAGEYISVKSQQEVFKYQIDIEREELREYPTEEKAELALIYQARGLPKEDADNLAALMIKNPETGLNTLAREELGLNPEELVSPIGAMLSSFFSFTIGASVPLIPFIFLRLPWALYWSLISTAIVLFSVGLIISLFTNRNALFSGIRMLLVGTIAGTITYSIGSLFGANTLIN